MARTALGVQAITRSGLEPAYTPANVDGHAIPNDGRTFLHVQCGATPCTATFDLPRTVDGQPVTDRPVLVPANEGRMIGPFPRDLYNQPGLEALHVDFSAVTSVTVAAIRL